ncbi:cold-shock protein [Streptomyces scopuliridis]|uniref:cold-shock protein n=1 Tax=Streptomyces scopuliridis TaxID=452529 RepID=UPI0036B10D1B
MTTGTVKWFNPAKGFGFIEPQGGGVDVFAHYAYIAAGSPLDLRQGQKVSFNLIHGQKGPHAENILPV